MSRTVHRHRFDIETETNAVTLQIGHAAASGGAVAADAAGVPGGFAKFFNRVVDVGLWGDLSDAARAVYLPLVRLADAKTGFRARAGQAALMRLSGLSRSSVKRGLKDLLTRRLLVIVYEGGVTPDGRNESNVYQLLVPEPRSTLEPTPGPDVASPSVRPRTLPQSINDLPAGSGVDGRPGRQQAPGRSARSVSPRPVSGPPLRLLDQNLSDSDTVRGADQQVDLQQAVSRLIELGISPTVAERLATQYTPARVDEVLETVRHRVARGTCDNPAGYVVEALRRQWPAPKAVADVRERRDAETRRAAEAARRAKLEQVESDRLTAEQRRTDAVIDALDDDELADLAAAVLAKYSENTPVRGVLARKPPRESRLMRMEIATLLGTG